jgi:hypothetical protein
MVCSTSGSFVAEAQVEPVAVGHMRHRVLAEEVRADILGGCMHFRLVLVVAVPPAVLAGTVG